MFQQVLIPIGDGAGACLDVAVLPAAAYRYLVPEGAPVVGAVE